MTTVRQVFNIRETVNSFNTPQRQSPEAVEDFTTRKVVQSKEIITGDHNANGSRPEVINVVYGTSATAPDVDTTTEGTLYIQYTA